MRRLLTLICEEQDCAASLDMVGTSASTGLLIVSGGSEVRAGAHGWQAQLAARLAEAGCAVFRFDRRGVGDSGGADAGFESALPDLKAAVRAFRAACPDLTRIIGLGNCDAATALALFGRDADLAALILLNPWTGDGDREGSLPSAAALRRRYVERLFSPAAWRRFMTGGVNLRALTGGLRKAVTADPVTPLAQRMADGLTGAALPATAILANRDPTAIAFDAFARQASLAALPIRRLPIRSHSFAEPGDLDLLVEACRAAIATLTGD